MAASFALLDPGRRFGFEETSISWRRSGWWRFVLKPERDPVRISSRGEGFRIAALAVDGNGPLAVVLPQLEGPSSGVEYAALRLARGGAAVLALLPPRTAFSTSPDAGDWLSLIQQRIRDGRAAVRMARDRFGDRCTVVIGLSTGAVAAVAVTALEPGIRGTVAMLGGGDLSLIGRESDEPRLVSLADAPLSAEMAAQLHAVDPLTWADDHERDRFLLLQAAWDGVIPKRAADALWERLGRPKRAFYPSRHESFAWFFPFAVNSAIDHVARVCGARSGSTR